jgi:capsular polysaccharide biosynthesis protein
MIYLVIKKVDDICNDKTVSSVVYVTNDKDIAVYQRDSLENAHRKQVRESKEQIKRYEDICRTEKLAEEEADNVATALCSLYDLEDVIGFYLIPVEENTHTELSL